MAYIVRNMYQCMYVKLYTIKKYTFKDYSKMWFYKNRRITVKQYPRRKTHCEAEIGKVVCGIEN